MPPIYKGSNRVIARYIGSAAVSSVMIGEKSCFAGALPSTGRTFLMSKSSLILEEGTGGPTWSRATKAWGFNELGYLEELASGCAFFGGARLVRNFIRNSALDNATWSNTGLTITAGQTDYLGGTSAFLLMETAATSNHDIRDDVVSPGAGRVMVICVVAKANGRDQIRISDNAYGAVSATFDLSAGTSVSTVGTSTITSLGGGYYKCIAKTSGSLANNAFYPRIYIYNGAPSYAGDITKGVILSHVQVSSVTNYDAAYVPEYVSVGVLSSPWHGAGIDGAKYFETDWQGAPIPAANLLGFRRESAATNNVLRSRRFAFTGNDIVSGGAWVCEDTIGSDLMVNGGFDDDGTGWVPDAEWTIGGGVATCAGVGESYLYRELGTSITLGKTYNITCTITRTAGSFMNSLGSSAQNCGAAKTANATYTDTIVCGANTRYYAASYGNFAGTLDNVSIKECAIQITPTTGIDGIANSATRLTWITANAVIKQALSGLGSSAARCTSAYLKLSTPFVGPLSMTQDDGATWTDVTSQLNSSTYVRPEITSVLANPIVGFKSGTAGDAIDVDCVQNEAGAVATSPIVTTTTTVTRNAESLTYQTAGNIDFAVGTAYCEAQLTSATSTRRAIYVGASAASYIDGSTTVWKAYDGTNTVVKSGLSDISTAKRKRVIAWGAGLKVAGDGLAPESGSFDGAFGGGATIEIGQAINGYIGPVAIYNYQMTDAELQAITT